MNLKGRYYGGSAARDRYTTQVNGVCALLAVCFVGFFFWSYATNHPEMSLEKALTGAAVAIIIAFLLFCVFYPRKY